MPLSPAEVEKRCYQAFSLFVHELLHAALNQALPEISDPTDSKKDLAQKICVRILEDYVCKNLGLPPHTPQEHVDELLKLFPKHSITPKDYEELAKFWRSHHDLVGFANRVLLLCEKIMKR